MTSRFSQLSVDQIRERYVRGGQPVSGAMLAKLRRDPRQGVRRIYEVLERRYGRERSERARLDAMLHFERVLWGAGLTRVAGVDESGMGPMAGPVVAAAVVFRPETTVDGIDDSKKLLPEERDRLSEVIRGAATGIGIGLADVDEIDRVNIHAAGLLAMRRAVEALPLAPEHVLVDARTIPDLDVRQNGFNRGDGLSYSIAAASIIAKTHRDRLMEALDREHPGYGLAQHKGYCTAAHQQAIRELGPSPVHRQSFLYIRELLGEMSARFYALKREVDHAGTAETLGALEAGIEGSRDALTEYELRKLRLVISRRWKSVSRTAAKHRHVRQC